MSGEHLHAVPTPTPDRAPGDTPLRPWEQAWVDWMDDEDFNDEIIRLCGVISELRQALDQALTCTAIWCVCEAHELLRQTEHDEGPW